VGTKSLIFLGKLIHRSGELPGMVRMKTGGKIKLEAPWTSSKDANRSRTGEERKLETENGRKEMSKKRLDD